MDADYEERRVKAQYPSWPDPIVALKCNHCGHEIPVTARGRIGVGRARALMRHHLYRCKPLKEQSS